MRPARLFHRSFFTIALALLSVGATGAAPHGRSATIDLPEVDIETVNPGRAVTRDYCLAIGLGMNAVSECGDLRLVYPIPAAASLNRSRAPILTYNSQHAHPQPIVRANVRLPSDTVGLQRVVAVLRVEGTPRAEGVWKGSAWPANRAAQIALTFDARGDATGLYRYTLDVTAYYSGVSYARTVKGELAIVNRGNSVFGSGWWIDKLDALALDGSGNPILMVGGDGSVRRYTAAGNNWVTMAIDRPDTLKREGSGFLRVLPNGVQGHFNASGRLTAQDVAGISTTYSYDTQGRLDRVTVPAAPGDFRFQYGANGVLRSVESPYPASVVKTSNVFATTSRIDSIVDPSVGSTRFGYIGPQSGRITTRTDASNLTTKFRYDVAGRITSSRFDPTSVDSLVTMVSSAEVIGLPTSTGFGATDTALVRTFLNGPASGNADTTSLKIDRYGALSAFFGANGIARIRRTDMRFPALVTQIDYPGGRTVTATFDSRGKPVSGNISQWWSAALGVR